MLRILKFHMILLWIIPAFGQAQTDILEEYINVGLENNLALQQKSLSYDQSLSALKSARGYFYPSVDFNARYSRAHGGREVSIPVADAITPVYQSLNEILTLLGQAAPFPEDVEDPQFTFFREKEHETKVRITQPFFHPEIYYNSKIKSDQAEVERAATETYKRQLVEDIKTAYFRHAMTLEAVQIYVSALDLLNANKRVTESLIRNDKVTDETLYRIEAEILSVEAQQLATEKDKQVSKAWFNFLLNKPLDSDIDFPESDSSELVAQEEVAVEMVIDNREETAQLLSAQSAKLNHVRLKKSAYLPTLSGAFDYGFQGEKYSFTKEDDFWMASLVLNWNLFSGFQRKHETHQTKLELQSLQTQQDELLLNLELQLTEASLGVEQKLKSLQAAAAKISFAKKNYRAVEKKFKQQTINHIELLDARNTLTQSELELAVAQYDLAVASAHYERVAALYEF